MPQHRLQMEQCSIERTGLREGKAAPTKQGNIVPTRPAPPGYRYDSFGTLIVSDA